MARSAAIRNLARRGAAAVAPLLLVALLLPSLAAAVPATEQYTPKVPNAKRERPTSPGGGSLPAGVAGELAGSARGEQLAKLATATGSPGSGEGDTDGDDSVIGALLRGLLDPLVLAALLAMAAIVGGARRLRSAT